MMILGAQAGTIASAPALTLIAGGNQALALVITVASNSLTSLLTPLILELSIGAVVAFPGAQMAGRVAGVVLLPVAAAQLVRRAAGPALRRGASRRSVRSLEQRDRVSHLAADLDPPYVR